MKVGDIRKMIKGYPDGADIVEMGDGNMFVSWSKGRPKCIETFEWLSKPTESFPESKITFIIKEVPPGRHRLRIRNSRFRKFIVWFLNFIFHN